MTNTAQPTTLADARRIAVVLKAHGADAQNAASAALSRAAHEAARAMRRGAPKFQTVLTNSITVQHVTDLEYRVVVGAGYAQAVEQGRKPGKGLPRFFDPAAASVVKWLETKAFAGLKQPRKGTARFTARELELRDRYMALSRHVKAKGIKAQPFAGPVVEELRRTLPQRVGDAVAAAVARANTGGPAGTTAGGTAT